MEFTGERLIPDQERDDDLYHEHIVRYLFAAQFARGRRILDAGCGTGYGAALLQTSDAESVLGMDIAPDAIMYAQQHYQQPGLSFVVGDVTAPDCEAASFDLIVSFEVIEHLEQPELLVSASARLLRPGGLFIVSTPNPATSPPGNPFHKHEMTATELTKLLSKDFPAIAMFEQDYATAIALRPSTLAPGQAVPPRGERWVFTPAQGRAPQEPDYVVAVCALEQAVLQEALQKAHSIMYELAADRLGERIRDLQTVQSLLDAKNRHLVEKDAHIAHLQEELRRQGTWAAELEQQLLALRKRWYVRLFARRLC